MERIKFVNTDGLAYNNIINAMKKMIDRERRKSFSSFNNNEYCWDIGFDILRGLKDVYHDLRLPSEIDEILDIKVRRILYHSDNASTICLTKDVNDRDPIMVTSRQSGKTNIQLKHLAEIMKKWNRGIVNNNPSIKNVIFNNPATIVFWNDGTKTVVKAENEPFDPEKGLAMAIAKKSLGNKSNYYNEFKKWLPEKEAKWKDPAEKVCSSCKYFVLGSSITHTCSECLKDETLPHWEKKYTLPEEEKFTLPNSNSEKTEYKLCAECKYADVSLFQNPCLYCSGHGKIKWEKADD